MTLKGNKFCKRNFSYLQNLKFCQKQFKAKHIYLMNVFETHPYLLP